MLADVLVPVQRRAVLVPARVAIGVDDLAA
jgi:hypothetical protein